MSDLLKKQLQDITNSSTKPESNNPIKKGNKVLDSIKSSIGESKLSPIRETTNTTVSSKYDFGLLPNEDINKARAYGQGTGRKLVNGITRAGINGALSVVENVASALDFEDYFNTDNEVGNWLSDSIKLAKDEVREGLPTYRENPNEHLDLGDVGWWVDNGSSLVESITGFVGAGFVLGAGIGAVGTAVNNSVRWLNGLNSTAKFSDIYNKVGNTTKTLANAMMLNQAESISIASDVYNQVYKRELEKLASDNLNLEPSVIEDIAKQKAADAASSSININRANILLNLTSASAFIKSPTLSRRLLKPISKSNTAKHTILEGGQEFLEEEVNLVGEEYGLSGDKNKILNRLFSAEGLEAGILGAVGGAGQTMITAAGKGSRLNPFSRVSTPEGFISANEAVMNRYNAQMEYIEEINKSFNSNKLDIDLLNSVYDQIQLSEDYKTAIKNKDFTKAQELSDKSFILQSFNSFETGTAEVLENAVKNLRDSAPKEGFNVDENSEGYYKKKADEALSLFKEFESDYLNSSNYINSKDVFYTKAFKRVLDNSILEKSSDLTKLETKAYLEATSLQNTKSLLKKDGKYLGFNLETDDLSNAIDPEIRSLYKTFMDEVSTLSSYNDYKTKLKERNELVSKRDELSKQLDTLTSEETQQRLNNLINSANEDLEKLKSESRARAKKEQEKVKQDQRQAEKKDFVEPEVKTPKSRMEKLPDGTPILVVDSLESINDEIEDTSSKEGINDIQENLEEIKANIEKRRQEELLNVEDLYKDKLPEDQYNELVAETNTEFDSELEMTTSLSTKSEIKKEEIIDNENLQKEFEVLETKSRLDEDSHDITKEAQDRIDEEVFSLNESLTEIEEGDQIFNYDRASNASNVLAYLSRLFKVTKNGYLVDREEISDELNKDLLNPVLLDPDYDLSGKEITFEVQDNYEGDVYLNQGTKEKVAWSAVKSDLSPTEYKQRVPILIKLEGVPTAYLHELPWITDSNVHPKFIQSERDNLNAIRNRILANTDNSGAITTRGFGRLFFSKDNSKKPLSSEEFKDVKLAVNSLGNLKVGEDSFFNGSLVNKKPLENGMVYMLVPLFTHSGSKYTIALPVNTDRISDTPEIKRSILAVTRLYLEQQKNHPIVKAIFDSTGFNITERNGYSQYVSLFLNNYNIGASENLKEFTKLQDVKANRYLFHVNKAGQIEISRGKGVGYKYINPTMAKNGKVDVDSFISALDNHLNSMFVNVDSNSLDKTFKIPLLNNKGELNYSPNYSTLIKSVHRTNLVANNISTTNTPKYTFSFQSSIRFNLTNNEADFKLNEPINIPLKEDSYVVLNEPLNDISEAERISLINIKESITVDEEIGLVFNNGEDLLSAIDGNNSIFTDSEVDTLITYVRSLNKNNKESIIDNSELLIKNLNEKYDNIISERKRILNNFGNQIEAIFLYKVYLKNNTISTRAVVADAEAKKTFVYEVDDNFNKKSLLLTISGLGHIQMKESNLDFGANTRNEISESKLIEKIYSNIYYKEDYSLQEKVDARKFQEELEKIKNEPKKENKEFTRRKSNFSYKPIDDDSLKFPVNLTSLLENVVISDLGYQKQKALVTSIVRDINIKIIKDGKIKIKDITSTWKKRFADDLKIFQEDLKEATSPQDINEINNDIREVSKILNNFDNLMIHVLRNLSGLSGIKYKEADEIGGNIEEDQAILERTSYEDEATFMIDPRDTLSVKLKRYLSIINEVDSSGNYITNYIGIPNIVGFDEVYNTLTSILSDSYSDYDSMISEIQKHYDSKPYLIQVVRLLNEADISIKNQFISAMTKHYMNMLLVRFKEGYFQILNSNSNAISQVIINSWSENIKHSGLYDFNTTTSDYTLNNKAKEAWLRDYNSIKDSVPNPDVVLSLLSRLGISLNEKTIKALFKNELSDSKGKAKNIAWHLNNGIFKNIAKTLLTSNKALSEINPISSGEVKTLAKLAAKYENNIYSNSHQTGNRTVYSYGFGKFFISRFKELKKDEDLLNKLLNNPFTQDSYYLSQLALRNPITNKFEINKQSSFYKNFEYFYSSLQPLKTVRERNKKNRESHKLSEGEQELYRLGLFQGVSQKTGSKRKIQMIYPTNSDKTTQIGLSTLAYSLNNKLTIDANIKPELIDDLYDYIVIPELKRMSQSFVSNIKGYNKGKNIFYSFTGLNNIVEIFEEDGSIATDIFVNKEKQALIKNEIQAHLEELVNSKLNFWQEEGITKDGNPTFLNKDYVKSLSTNNKVKEAAIDMIVNYLIFNQNMFQLFISDPANFYKKESSTNELDKVQLAIDTANNIGKRLASDIAPGIELANSRKDSFNVFVSKDHLPKSISNEYYIRLGLEKEYSKLDSTDAQEYTTLGEHLDILIGLGRLTSKEIKEIEAVISNPSMLISSTTLSKILQPIKPVYVDNKWDDKIERRVYIKSSSFPLIPQLTAGLEIDKLRVQMENSGIDRVAFETAVKIGGFENAGSVFDSNGNLIDNIPFNQSTLNLSRKGFRIQQDIPYKESKSSIGNVTQASKLLFLNILNKSGFKYKGESKTGRELQTEYFNKYRKLLKKANKEFLSSLEDKNGNLNIEKLKSIIIQEAVQRNYPISVIEAIADDETLSNIKYSPYSQQIESLFTSIVNSRIINQKFAGASYVLGSEAGFKTKVLEGEEGQAKIKTVKGIAFTSNWTGQLLPMRYENGEIKPAQVLIPMKFKDNYGNLFNLKDLINKDGYIDSSILPTGLLKLIGMRIPNQGHNSKAYIEIVGFLPKESGDLMIAPADFTKQMGSDFDVDKLYTYMYNLYFDQLANKFVKLNEDSASNLEAQINNELKSIDVNGEGKELLSIINSGIKNLKDKAIIENSEINEKELLEDLLNDPEYSYLVTEKNNLKRLIYLSRIKDDLSKMGIQNDIVDIHVSIMSNPDISIQKQIAQPLGEGNLLNLANKISASRLKTGRFSMLSDEYQRFKYLNATAGKSGVGVFSLDSVFNATLQVSNNEIKFNDLEIGFGDNKSTGILNNERTLDSSQYISDTIQYFQSASVDNEKLQVLDKLNVNDQTFGAISLLAQLGFNETEIISFVAQRSIIEYVNLVKKLTSPLSSFKGDARKEAIKQIKEKYQPENADTLSEDEIKAINELADVSSDELLSLIYDETNPSFRNYQYAIINKFSKLNDSTIQLGTIKSIINIDSAGVGKSLLHSNFKQDLIESLDSLPISNIESIFGDFINSGVGGKRLLVDNDNTTYIGLNAYYGLDTVNRTFSQFFPYNSITLVDKDFGIFPEIEDLVKTEYKTINSRINLRQKIWGDFKSYLYSNENLEIYSRNLFSERNRLLMDNKNNKSLASIVKEIKESNLNENNLFIKLLSPEVNLDQTPSIIKFLSVSNKQTDEAEITSSFADLFVNSKQLGTFNGKNYSTRNLAEDLVTYSFITGGSQEAIQFMKFIPYGYLSLKNLPAFLSDVEISDVSLVGFNRGINPVRDNKNYFLVSDFARQFIQHNANETLEITYDLLETSTDLQKIDKIQLTKKLANVVSVQKPFSKVAVPSEFIHIKGKEITYLFEWDGNSYNRIPTLGASFSGEWQFDTKNANSVIKRNEYYEKETSLKPTIDSILEDTKVLHEGEIKNTSQISNVDNIPNINLTSNVTSTLTEDNLESELEKIIANSNSPYYSYLASTILENNLIKDITLEKTTDTIGNHVALFNKNLKRIFINNEYDFVENSYQEVLLHEVVHAFTANKLTAYKANPNSVSKEEGELIQGLINIRDQIKTVIESGKAGEFFKDKFESFKKGDISQLANSDKIFFSALNNDEEFLSVSLTNVEFQNFLKGISVEKSPKTFFQSIIDIVSNLIKALGFEIDSNSVLKKVLNDTLQIGLFSVRNNNEEVALSEPIDEVIIEDKIEDKVEELKLDKKYELFTNVYANKEQREAIDKMEDFLNNPNNKEKVFTLIGRGGTGKTTIIKKVIAGLNGSIGFIAPTHKAKSILQQSVGKSASTLAKVLAIKLNESTGKFEIDNYSRSQNGVPIHKYKYIIIDEASMVSDGLMNEVLSESRRDAKIIFMGDNVQLPPVGQVTDSKIFDFQGSKLIERMRQGEESPIVPITDKVANNVEQYSNAALRVIDNRINKYNPATNEGVIFENNEVSFINEYVNDFKEHPTSTKLIVFNNQDNDSEQSVKNMNLKIRSRIYPDEKKTYVEGELITAYDSYVDGNDNQIIDNSVDYTVERISSEPEEIPLNFSVYSKKMGQRNYSDTFTGYAVSLRNNITGEEVKTNEPIFLLTRKSKMKLKSEVARIAATRDYQLSINLAQKFPNFEYGYAVTSHKSQGSTYRNAYVAEDNILGGGDIRNNKEKNQSLYVAVSRPSKKLVILSNSNPDQSKDVNTFNYPIDNNKPTSNSVDLRAEEIRLGLRHSSGKIKKIFQTNYYKETLPKIGNLNKYFISIKSPYIAKVVKVIGEQGDTREYDGIQLEWVSNLSQEELDRIERVKRALNIC